MSELKQYALVDGSEIVSIGPFEATAPNDGCTWLPIENEDSQPFDPEQHWRLPPSYRIDGARVVRSYQVVPKSENAA